MADLNEVFADTGAQLDRIVYAYERKAPSHPETIVEYANGSISSFNIVGTINSNSIQNKSSVIKIDIRSNVTSIANKAFSKQNGYSSIKTLIIPDSVISSEGSICYQSSTLTHVEIGNGLSSVPWGAFEWCSSLKSVTFPKNLKSIGGNAFSECLNIPEITIPATVTNIGSNAFHDCVSLSCITCECSTAPTAGSNVFGGVNGIGTYTGRNTYTAGTNVLRIPTGATGYNASYWLDPLQNASKCGFHIEYI